MLRRYEIEQARRARVFCEAVYCGTAPGLAGKDGLPVYNDFLSRMDALMNPKATPTGIEAAEEQAFQLIAARAAARS